MAKNKTRRKTKKLNQQHLTLNAAIGIVGVLLLGFIYSFSQNASYTGVLLRSNSLKIIVHKNLPQIFMMIIDFMM
ncbi:hypothetical protein Ct9H90mP29_00830 [bacterium]|nr:MAG: hypothetical protein Ct9H90mP29_00830 [bacterium]